MNARIPSDPRMGRRVLAHPKYKMQPCIYTSPAQSPKYGSSSNSKNKRLLIRLGHSKWWVNFHQGPRNLDFPLKQKFTFMERSPSEGSGRKMWVSNWWSSEKVQTNTCCGDHTGTETMQDGGNLIWTMIPSQLSKICQFTPQHLFDATQEMMVGAGTNTLCVSDVRCRVGQNKTNP